MLGALLLISAALLAASLLLGFWSARVWLVATVIGAGGVLLASMNVLFGGEPWLYETAFRLSGQAVNLRLDAISALFLALLNFVGAAGAVYVQGYWSDHEHPDSAPRGRFLWSGMILSMSGVLLSANGLHFLIFWELFALCSYFLITLERQERDARSAGWVYLSASHAGTLCLFAFFAVMAAHTGTWKLGPVHDHPELAPLFWVALFGFGIKAGIFPLHIWLPSAHANAPSHVSALMSGVAIKMGIYGLVRFSGWLPLPAAAGWTLMSIGAITALLGIAFALGQNDFKRLLAYSSVENIGIMVVGIGGGVLGLTHGNAPWGRLAMAGALFHLWNHGVFKSLMFFGAGSVLHGTGTREMSKLGGLWRTMPWTAALFAVGAMAVCALPPLNGFVSEWLIYLGLFHAVTSHTNVAWIAMLAAIMLGVTGALALASFVKASAMIFLGAPRTNAGQHAHEAGWWMRIPMVLGAATCVVIGCVPLLVWPAIMRVLGTWQPAWAQEASPSPLAALGPIQIVIAVLVLCGVALLGLVVRRRGWKRGPTWDCGYALPTARMQYTSGSFGGIATGWFRWILLPEREARRPRGFFPGVSTRMERVPETVLERVLQPVGALVLRFAALVRRLQHGKLQYYIAYVVVGLAGLIALVAMGGHR